MYHIDFKLLRSFAAVATECSVTRAAQRLNLTQPTVSGQIKELEQTLGFLLFHRTSRRVTLSRQGERLLPFVEALLDSADMVRREAEAMRHEGVTRFRLGAAMYTMDFADRIDLLDAVASALPEVGFTIDNRLQSDQIRDLLSDQLDAALLLGIAVDLPASEFMRTAPAGCIVNEVQYPAILDRLVLCRRPIGLLVPAESDLAKCDLIPQAELRGRRVAMLSSEHGEAFINPIANFLLSQGAVAVALAEGNALAVERYALRNSICGIGIGWFPILDGLVQRPVEGMNFHMDFSVVMGTSPNKAARKFFDFAQKWRTAAEETRTSGAAPRPFAVPGLHAPVGSA